MVKYVMDTRDRKPLGRTGETVSAIGIGTWGIRDYGRAEKTLVRAVELGLNLIDTAEMYGYGRAEELVGRVVRVVGRENVFITTKMLPSHLSSRDEVLKAGQASLRRLGVSEVDLFLIHWPNTSLSVEEQVRNFEVLIDAGYTRYVGVSNFDAYELENAVASTKKSEIVADQVHYSVLSKGLVEGELLSEAIRHRITIRAYTPLERVGVSRNSRVRSVAKEVNKTPVQVALNYLISRPNVVAIPKTESLNHLLEIKGALGWRLPKHLIERLEKA